MKGGGDDFIINMLSQKDVAVINTRFYELQLDRDNLLSKEESFL